MERHSRHHEHDRNRVVDYDTFEMLFRISNGRLVLYRLIQIFYLDQDTVMPLKYFLASPFPLHFS